ncbi:STAS domain-containing protein, partial [Pontiella sp.]
MQVTFSKDRGIGVVRVGKALTAATVDAFRDQLADWQEVEPGVKNYVVDLEMVDFLDSA